MTPATTAKAAIRSALEDGPTPGPWATARPGAKNVYISSASGYVCGPYGAVPQLIDASYIAACNPEALRAILAENEELLAGFERMKARCVAACLAEHVGESIDDRDLAPEDISYNAAITHAAAAIAAMTPQEPA